MCTIAIWKHIRIIWNWRCSYDFRQEDTSVTQYFNTLTRYWQQLTLFETYSWKCTEDTTIYRSIVEKKGTFKFLQGSIRISTQLGAESWVLSHFLRSKRHFKKKVEKRSWSAPLLSHLKNLLPLLPEVNSKVQIMSIDNRRDAPGVIDPHTPTYMRKHQNIYEKLQSMLKT